MSLCPKQGLEMEAVVLNRVGFLEYFCPKQGQDSKPLAAPLYPNMGQVPPKGVMNLHGKLTSLINYRYMIGFKANNRQCVIGAFCNFHVN